MNLESKTINQETLPFENLSELKPIETVTISYDKENKFSEHNPDTISEHNPDTINVSGACIAFGLISLPFTSMVFSLGFIIVGGALSLLCEN